MKWLMLLACAGTLCFLAGSSLQVNRGALLPWRTGLYGMLFGIGWQLYRNHPQYRGILRRIALWFTVLVALNEIVPEVIR